MKNSLSVTALILCMLFGTSSSLRAKLVIVELKKVIEQSHLIILGQVMKVSEYKGFEREIAEIKIIETWKGEHLETIKIDVKPSWDCDTSDSIEGETAVFMLEPAATRPWKYMIISHAGEGRMPIELVEDVDYAVIPAYRTIKYPESLDLVKTEDEWIRLIKLSDLKKYILDNVKNPN